MLLAITFVVITAMHGHLYPNEQEKPTIYFDYLTMDDGLSDNRINCIFQDSRGFMWFGTKNGLNRYDGNSVTNYNKSAGYGNDLLGKYIYCIYEDHNHKGILWIGTVKGLIWFDIKSGQVVPFSADFRELDRLCDMRISAIKKDHLGNFWIGTSRSGLFRFDVKTKKLKQYEHISGDPTSLGSKHVDSIHEDNKNRLWIGTQYGGGINLFVRKSENFIRYLPDPDRPEKKVRNGIDAMFIDHNGRIWMGNSVLGLFEFKPETKEFRMFPRVPFKRSMLKNDVNAIMLDKSGRLWVGYSDGLTIFNRQNNQFTIYQKNSMIPYSLSDNYITCIFQDRSGVIWVGTENKGINKFRLKENNFRTITKGLYDPGSSALYSVLDVYEDNEGIIWLGTQGKGLVRYNRVTGQVENFLPEPDIKKRGSHNTVTCITEDKNGYYWVGTSEHGLKRFDFRTKQFLTYPLESDFLTSPWVRYVNELLLDRDGYLWIATIKDGLFRLDPETGRYKHFSLNINDYYIRKSYYIVTLYLDKNDQLWIGSRENLLKYNPENEQFERFSLSLRKTSELVKYKNYNILEDMHGNFWLSAYGQGIIALDGDKKVVKSYNEKDGLVTNAVYGMLEDKDGLFWISSADGLSRFNPVTEQFRNLDVRDGLASNRFTHKGFLKASDGTMFFGTKNGGVVVFDPREITANQLQPNVVVTDFQVFSESIMAGDIKMPKRPILESQDIELDYSNYVFLIEFAALDYTAPERNQYAYKMDGLDEDWNYIGNKNHLTFINLPPNSYTLRIRGSNSDGVWNEEGIRLNINISAPYWKSPWYLTLFVLTVFSVFFTIYRVRINRVRRRSQELERINKQLNDQINQRIQTEQQLKESEEKHRTLVENMEESVYTLDREGFLTFLNPSAAKNFGGKPKDFLGQSLKKVFSEKNAALHIANIEKVISDGKPVSFEVEEKIRGKDQALTVVLQPLKDKNGKPNFVLCISTDVTRQRRLEAQLRQAQKMEAIGELAGGIAHDFNNLLSIVRGYSRMMLSDWNENDDHYDAVAEIDKAGERAQSLTRQLLAFSRKQIMDPKVLNLNDLIRDLKKMLTRVIGEDIKLRTLLDTHLKNIYADPGQMEQVILNLIINARDAMPNGGDLIIETENIQPDTRRLKNIETNHKNEFVSLKISDTGTGMDHETKSKAFEPFFTTKEQGRGSGLGLSMVFGIVKQSDGYIWLESEKGSGTSFIIYFPVVYKTIKKVSRKKESDINLNGKETILLVEDENGVRRMIAKMLSRYGFKILQAAHGREAIEIYNNNQENIHLVLTDVVMPEMSGLELMEILKKDYPEIKAIYMSGHTDDAVVRHGIVERDITFIQKPFTAPHIIREIKTALGHS